MLKVSKDLGRDSRSGGTKSKFIGKEIQEKGKEIQAFLLP
jgi:hypothetical protein